MPYIIHNGKIVKIGAVKRKTKRRVVTKNKLRVVKPKESWKEKRHNWFVNSKKKYGVSDRNALAHAMAKDPSASPRERRWANKVISGVKTGRGERRTRHGSSSHGPWQYLYDELRKAKESGNKALVDEIRFAIYEIRGEARHS